MGEDSKVPDKNGIAVAGGRNPCQSRSVAASIASCWFSKSLCLQYCWSLCTKRQDSPRNKRWLTSIFIAV